MIKWRFNAAMPALYQNVGVRSGGRIEIHSTTDGAVFGPYLDVPAGLCEARILLDGPATGQATVDIASHGGTKVHVSHVIDLSALADNRVLISATLAEPTPGLEVRLRQLQDVTATIVGLEIDLIASSTEEPAPGRPTGWETSKTYQEKLESGFWKKYLSGPSVLEIGYKGYWGGTVPVVPQAIGIDIGYPGYDGVTLPFADGSVDAIYSSHCFEHIADYKGALQDWYRLLKVGGHMVIVVPHHFLFERRRRLPSRFNYDHKRFYLPDTLLAELKESLPENGYRVRHLRENDEGFDYSVLPPASGGGLYEIEVVVEKIRVPNWRPDDGSVRPYSAAEFFSQEPSDDPFALTLSLSEKDCILWGPYTALAPADYEVEFLFEARGVPRGPLAEPIIFDVAMKGERIASRTIGMAGGSALRRGRVALQFSNPSDKDEIFEFRIFAPSASVEGSLVFKGVIVRYAHP